MVVVTRRPTPPRRQGSARGGPARPAAAPPSAKAAAVGRAEVKRPGAARAVLPQRLRMPVVRPVTAVGITLAVVTLLLAPYLQPWWAQRSQLASTKAQVAELQRQVDELGAQNRRWDDPSYVRTQARSRLHYVMPGEVSYVLLDDGTPKAVTDPRQAAAGSLPAAAGGQAWYRTVWQSVQSAGSPSSAAPPTTP